MIFILTKIFGKLDAVTIKIIEISKTAEMGTFVVVSPSKQAHVQYYMQHLHA